MKIFFSVVLFLGLSISSFASGLSAHRKPNESYEVARDRHTFNQSFTLPNQSADSLGRYISAERAKKPLKQLDITHIPDVGSYPDLEREFFYVRDTRFIKTNNANFPRRLTWMYPDDGCYARAELAKNELNAHNFPEPKKLFVFGSLHAPSKNSETGYVQWWYHVAVTYRVGADVYVFDPAIEPLHPLKISEWNRLVGGESSQVQYSICDQNTYDPSNDCNQPTPVSIEMSLQEQKQFLSAEWDRLLDLHRNPEKELGDSPPWLSPAQ